MSTDKLLQDEIEKLTKRQAYIRERKTSLIAEIDRLDTEEAKVEASIAQSNELLARLQETF